MILCIVFVVSFHKDISVFNVLIGMHYPVPHSARLTTLPFSGSHPPPPEKDRALSLKTLGFLSLQTSGGLLQIRKLFLGRGNYITLNVTLA